MDSKTNSGAGISPGSTTPLSRPGADPPRPSPAVQQARLSRVYTDPPASVGSVMVLLRWLQNLSMGIWIGAILTVGAFVARIVFHEFPNRVQAGSIVGPIVTQVTYAGIACGVIYLIVLFIHDPLWHKYHPTPLGNLLFFLKFLLVAAMIVVSLYLWLRVTPVMSHYQNAARVVNGALTGGAGRAFDYWHHLYEKADYGIFGGGAMVMLLGQMSRRKR